MSESDYEDAYEDVIYAEHYEIPEGAYEAYLEEKQACEDVNEM